MSITTTNSTIIRKTATAAFFDELPQVPATVDMSRYVTRFATTTKNTDFGWFGAIPYPVEWTSARTHVGVSAYTDTITPKKWDLTLDFDVDTFEDDQTGTAAARGRQVAAMARDHFNFRATQVLAAGTAGTIDTAYDGQFFFDTDHDESGSNQSNDLTTAAATGTDPTTSEFETAVGDGIEAMMGFTDDQGNPLAMGDIEVMVPPEMFKVATVVLGANGTMGGLGGNVNPADRNTPVAHGSTDTVIPGVSGIFRGLQWQVNPHLTDASGFFLLRRPSMGRVGPLVLNDRKAWTLKTFDPTNSSECDENQVISFRADARYEFGYGTWQDAIWMDFT